VSTKGREQVGPLWRRVTLALVSLAVALLSVELVLAHFLPQQTVEHVLSQRAGMYRESSSFLTELIPGFVGREREREFDVEIRLNSEGFRQPDFAPADRALAKIVAIGDSFTFGHGVEGEDAYPRVLERLLDARLPAGVQVVNAGVPGRWVDEYYLELRERSLRLDPNLVVVGLFVGNDIDGEDARTHVWKEVDEKGRPLKIDENDARIEEGYRVERVRKARWTLPVIRDSHLAQLVFDAARAVRDEIEPPRLKEAAVFAPDYSPETQTALARVEDLLLAMRDLSASHGARLLIVLIPLREQIYPERRRGQEDLDWDKPQRILGEFLERSGIDWLDLRPALTAATSGAPLYFETDSHWTPRGHAVAASAIAEHILAEGILGGAHVS
jgi:SGNH hydrolase-like domain, acetyltransferase AlgX